MYNPDADDFYLCAIEGLGLSQRPEQFEAFKMMVEGYDPYRNKGVIQASTGIGKTLAISLAALYRHISSEFDGFKAIEGDIECRVFVVTSTVALARELQATMETVCNWLYESSGKSYTSSLLLGLSNFVSSERLKSRMDALYLDEDEIKQCNALLAWNGTIDEFEFEYGPLPDGLEREYICQNSAYRDQHRVEEREEAKNADIIIATHAMLLADIRSYQPIFKGNIRHLIVDEADALVDMFNNSGFRRHNIKRLFSPYREVMTQNQRDLVDAIIELMLKIYRYDHTSFDEEARNVAESVIDILAQIVAEEVPDTLSAVELDDYQVMLNEVQSLIGEADQILGLPFALVGTGCSREYHEPAIVTSNPFASRVFGSYSDKYASLILTSATLSDEQDDIVEGSKWLRSDLGIAEEPICYADLAPPYFGDLTITLADYSHEITMNKGQDFHPDWLEMVSNHIEELDGITLVVTSSYRESEHLAMELTSSKYYFQQRGEKLSYALSQFKRSGAQVFISPVATTGLEFLDDTGRSRLEHIVLTRLGFPPPLPIDEMARGRYPTEPDKQVEMRNICKAVEFLSARSKVIRRMMQVIGRGIRHRDDSVTFHVMDKRFPKATDAWEDNAKLANGIPKRFHDAYLAASYPEEEGELEEIWF